MTNGRKPTRKREPVKFSETKKQKMNINELTIGQAKELATMFAQPKTAATITAPWILGKIYLIRTVTMIDTGKLIEVTPTELVLEDAAWIADTGRFADALKSLEFLEIEPFPDGRVIVGRGSVIDAVEINRPQRSVK